MEVVEKIAQSSRVGPNELAVYRKVIARPISEFDALIFVLNKFQAYHTKDASAKGVKIKIKRREPNAMTAVMFKQPVLWPHTLEYFFMKDIVATVPAVARSLAHLATINSEQVKWARLMVLASVSQEIERWIRISDSYLRFPTTSTGTW